MDLPPGKLDSPVTGLRFSSKFLREVEEVAQRYGLKRAQVIRLAAFAGLPQIASGALPPNSNGEAKK